LGDAEHKVYNLVTIVFRTLMEDDLVDTFHLGSGTALSDEIECSCDDRYMISNASRKQDILFHFGAVISNILIID